MDNCYICLEKTTIYFKLKNCNCSIYCHDECFKIVQKINKCIICKKNINDTFWINKVNEEAENILLFKIINKLYDNELINNILSLKSNFYLIFFVYYSLIISLLTIGLSPIVIFCYLVNYIYYYIKYRNKIFNNYEKKYIIN